MTDRKPPQTSFTSWIDRQVTEAEERGAFDNLPGAGKPIPHRAETDDVQAWLRDYLRREGVPAQDLLPTPLRLRREIEQLTAWVHELPSERQVREAVRELNRQVMDWRRGAVGPPVFVRLVDEDDTVSRWRAARHARSPEPAHATPGTAPDRGGRWRRLASALGSRGGGRRGAGDSTGPRPR
ncbi:MAG: DUF1992 domain-containing protein [Streptosporangiaceae bacterium]|nr:DUF1992 domain-containing protein [Streptosporangiaceae bacterium]